MEKRDDLPKDGVREIADAVHPRFYGFLGFGGGRVAASPRAAGCRIYNRRHRWQEPHLLGAGVSRLHFPQGSRIALMDLSRVTNGEPSCSASEEEGELGFFCSSEELGEMGLLWSEVRNLGVRVERANVRWVGVRRKKGTHVFWGAVCWCG